MAATLTLAASTALAGAVPTLLLLAVTIAVAGAAATASRIVMTSLAMTRVSANWAGSVPAVGTEPAQ